MGITPGTAFGTRRRKEEAKAKQEAKAKEVVKEKVEAKDKEVAKEKVEEKDTKALVTVARR